MAIQPSKSIPRVKASDGAQNIFNTMMEAGGVIIENFLTDKQINRLNQDLDKPFHEFRAGSSNEGELYKIFHGEQTKRLTNLVTHSEVFRYEILDYELLYEILDLVYSESCNGSYWMGSAQAIEIGPGNTAQPLHRDQGQYRVFDLLGPSAPEAMVNFLIAVTEFTEENGATRVIPGSHKWQDFGVEGDPDKTIPAIMKPGDALFITGKTIHGGGANTTEDERRRGIAFSFVASYLTPEEAYPFQIDLDVAKKMSVRAQRSVGFRSLYPARTSGLWQHDFAELANYLHL